ncbi:MAG: hypothetical protein KC493_04855 [Bacteriovoracaceae bacterium]|nr:hypothetical protein [Bacteriovoracaceae bacterium]
MKDDKVSLGLFQGEQEILKSDSLELKDISLTGVGFVSEKEFVTGQKLELKLEFSDYKNIIDGIVVRSGQIDGKFATGIIFDFEQGETFDSFFQKFIKTFPAKRLKSQLINLLDEQNLSVAETTDMDTLSDLNAEVSNYGNSPMYLESIKLQMIEVLELDFLDILRKTNDKDFVALNNELEIEESFDVSESIINSACEDKKTINAQIMSDPLLSSDNFLRNYHKHYILAESISRENGEVKGIAIASRKNNPKKFNETDLNIFKLFCREVSRFLTISGQGISNEPVKYLNPKKPREFAMIGQSEDVLNIRKFISKSKAETEPILIKGVAGVGRKLLAKIIHSEGKTGHLDFREFDGGFVNHIRALSDISSSNRVPLEYKEIGSIYITNFNKLDVDFQKKLLEFAYSNKSQLRFICSVECTSEEELNPEVTKSFKNNKVRISELKKRKEDIPILVNHLIKKECKKRGLLPKTTSANVLDKFKLHEWKGNVRELKTAVSRLVSWHSSSHYINTFPPENYQIFDTINNSEFDIRTSVAYHTPLFDEFSKEELDIMIKWSLVAVEMKNHDGSLKKTALALGKPHTELVEIFEKGEEILENYEQKKKVA